MKEQNCKGFSYLFSYEIQEEGPVQQISYVSDTEQGYLRLVAEEDIDQYRFVGAVWHGVQLNTDCDWKWKLLSLECCFIFCSTAWCL